MKKLKISLIAAGLAAAFVTGCCDKECDKESGSCQVAISVNGKTLKMADLDRDVATILKAQEAMIPSNQVEMARRTFRNNLAQSFLIENVLAAKAKEAGITVTDEEFKKREEEFLKAVAGQPDAPKSLEEAAAKSPLGKERAMNEFRNGVLIEKYLKDVQAKAPAKDFKAQAKEIIDGIVSNNAAVAKSEQSALERIKALKAELDKVTDSKAKAEKFAELAKNNSDCPSGKRAGGDLDFFTHGMMVKEFDEVAFKQKVGEISGPVKTDFGYHLIMTTDKKAAVEAKEGDDKSVAEPEKVRASHILIRIDRKQEVPEAENIIDMLKRNAEREFTMKHITDLIRAAKIEVCDEFKALLPPPEKEETVEKTSAK